MVVYTPWVDWNDPTSTATTTDMFNLWCDTDTTSITPTTSTWVDWNPQYAEFRVQEPTREELNQIEIRKIGAQIRRGKAIDRARELLIESLTPEQREEYDKNKSFIVFGQKTGKRYLIKDGRAGNVHELDKDDRPRHKYCAHPLMMLPNPDTMLAQKLMLECHEQDFLDKANVS